VRRLGLGVAPGRLDDVRSFYRRELPKHGFRLGAGDAEENEAETDFAGEHARGHLRLRTLEGCSGAVSVAVAVRPA
jgi:hypothetical protein